MARVTGLGGVFYKVADPQATQAWYQEHLGIGGEWGATFRYADEGSDDPYSLLSPFRQGTDYMDPSTADFMINLRVDDHDDPVGELRRIWNRYRNEVDNFVLRVLDPEAAV